MSSPPPLISNAKPPAWLRYGGYVAAVGTARVISVLISTATFPFIVRRLGVEMYGFWSYVLSITAFVDLVANPGLVSHATRQAAARRLESADEISDVFVLRGLLAILAVACVFGLAAFETRHDVARLLRLYGILFFTGSLFGNDYLLGALELFHERSLLAVIQQSLYAVGIFLLIRSPQSVYWIPICIVGSSLVTSLVGWIVLSRAGFRLRLRVRPRNWWQILVPSAHYAASTLMSTLYHRTGHVVVRWMLGGHDLGIYAAATRLVDILRNFLTIFHGVLMPKLAASSDSSATLHRVTRLSVGVLALLGFPQLVGIFVTANAVVPWFLGLQYLESAHLLTWLSGYLIAAPAATLFCGTILYALGRYRSYLASTSAGAIVGILCFLVLVRYAGLPGACLAFVLGEAAVAVTSLCLSPPEVRTACWSPVVLVALFASAGMGILLRVFSGQHVHPLALVALGISIYVVLCALLGWKIIRQEIKSYV